MGSSTKFLGQKWKESHDLVATCWEVFLGGSVGLFLPRMDLVGTNVRHGWPQVLAVDLVQ